MKDGTLGMLLLGGGVSALVWGAARTRSRSTVTPAPTAVPSISAGGTVTVVVPGVVSACLQTMHFMAFSFGSRLPIHPGPARMR